MPSKNSRGPGFQGLALTELVRAKGLEPPHLAILEPKSSASTSSATPAARRIPASCEPAKQGSALRRAGRKGQAARRDDRVRRNVRAGWGVTRASQRSFAMTQNASHEGGARAPHAPGSQPAHFEQDR